MKNINNKKEQKMEKYFMKGTDNVLEFGDQIELDFSKDKDGKTCHHHMECKFIPELVATLLESGVIEIREVEDDDVDEEGFAVDAEELEEIFDEIIATQENVKEQLVQVTAILENMNKLLATLVVEQEKPKKDARKPTGK